MDGGPAANRPASVGVGEQGHKDKEGSSTRDNRINGGMGEGERETLNAGNSGRTEATPGPENSNPAPYSHDIVDVHRDNQPIGRGARTKDAGNLTYHMGL